MGESPEQSESPSSCDARGVGVGACHSRGTGIVSVSRNKAREVADVRIDSAPAFRRASTYYFGGHRTHLAVGVQAFEARARRRSSPLRSSMPRWDNACLTAAREMTNIVR